MSDKDRPVFLETITCADNDLLVRIEDIQFVYKKYSENGSWVIVIQGKNDSFKAEEYFWKDDEKLNKRYEQIKSIIGAE